MEYLKAQYATQEGIISLQENSFRLDEDQQVIMDNTQNTERREAMESQIKLEWLYSNKKIRRQSQLAALVMWQTKSKPSSKTISCRSDHKQGQCDSS